MKPCVCGARRRVEVSNGDFGFYAWCDTCGRSTDSDKRYKTRDEAITAWDALQGEVVTADELMTRLVNRQVPQIFQVLLIKTDHTEAFTATAELRMHYSKSYSASGATVIDALLELEKVIESTVCPNCRQRMEDE